jgi:hypothetical protein
MTAEIYSPNTTEAGDAIAPIQPALIHPLEATLKRYVEHTMGPRRKALLLRHLKVCGECRDSIVRLQEISRRFRDLERVAIEFVGSNKGR